MIHFVGAGPGSRRSDHGPWTGMILQQADVVIYAGSLVNPGAVKEYKGDMSI